MQIKPIRVYRGKGNYLYVTNIGDFKVKGQTGDWNVFRNNNLVGNMELLGDVEHLIDAYIRTLS